MKTPSSDPRSRGREIIRSMLHAIPHKERAEVLSILSDDDREAITAASDPIRQRGVKPPKRMQPNPAVMGVETGRTSLVAAATGEPLQSLAEVGGLMLEKRRAWRGSTVRGREAAVVASIRQEYPEERILGEDLQENEMKLRQLLGEKALVAAGGLCAPLEGYYQLPSVETAARPVRGALPAFRATRGGIRKITTPGLTCSPTGGPPSPDPAGAIGHTTEAEDTDNTTKPCLSITCPDEEECAVDAVSRCLEIGNWNEQFFPEFVARWIELSMVAHAREAEARLLDCIAADSVLVTSDDTYGASRTLLSAVDRAAAGMRYRNRIPRTTRLRAIFPSWALEVIRADLTRSPNSGELANIRVPTDEEIAQWFRVRGVEPVFSLDAETGETGQDFDCQAAGGLRPFPDRVIWYLHPIGTFLFLDGGTLDLGVVRDSSLNVTNDFQVFAESFETCCFLGPEALKVDSDICVDGTYSPAGEAISCVTGS